MSVISNDRHGTSLVETHHKLIPIAGWVAAVSTAAHMLCVDIMITNPDANYDSVTFMILIPRQFIFILHLQKYAEILKEFK